MKENKQKNKDLRENLAKQRDRLESQISKNEKRLKVIQRIETDIWHYFTAERISLGEMTKLAWRYRNILILRRRIKEAIIKDKGLIDAIVKILETYKITNRTLDNYRPQFLSMKKMLDTDFGSSAIMDQIDLIDVEDNNIEELVGKVMDE